MQSVNSAFTAEERDTVRSVTSNLQVAWHKQSTLSSRTFTIGVSTIGGSDIIGVNPGSIGSPGNYRYFDESAYVMGLSWENSLNIPLGGLAKGAAEADLDNTSGRFLPDYLGGRSELFTAVNLPRRPMIINAGFKVNDTDYNIPQFSGITKDIPKINLRDKVVSIAAFDYVDFFADKYLDQSVMFTGQTTKTVLTTLFNQLGMSTAQYDLDDGLNTIPFGIFDKGEKFGEVINDIVQAENGHLIQDESGIFHFWNRQHFTLSPYSSVVKTILTGQVLEAESPTADNLINVVEVKSQRYAKQSSEQIFKLAQPVALAAGANTDVFVNFDNPVIQMDTVSFFVANTLEDESGTDITTSVTVHYVAKFARSAKITFINGNASSGFLTQLTLYGRTAKPVSDIYARLKDDSSVTAYEEQPLLIENKYIQDQTWAQSLAQLMLKQYSEPDRLQTVTIRAIPELQLGDLVSWLGVSWRIYGIKSKLSPSTGFIQEITMSRTDGVNSSYFTIGVSTIGGSDIIAA